MKLTRAVATAEVQIDKDERKLSFSFSSEAPVERWFGKEVLSHKDGAANLSRLNSGASVLFNHRMDELVGVVERAWIEDKRGHVEIRFSKRAKAEELMRDVEDGIVKNVSFGYMIDEMERTKSGKEGDEFTATRWTPYEVSFVTVPADPSVGIGRSEESEAFIRSLITEAEPAPEHGAVEEEMQKRNSEGKGTEKIMTEKTEPKIDINAEREAARAEERARAAGITALGEKFGKADLARQLIDSGKSMDEARNAFLESLGQKQVPLKGDECDVGLTDKEVRKFSFMRAINAMANPGDRRAQEAAGFEREVSEAAISKTGKAARGFLVPVDVLRGVKRDLLVGTPTAGGNLVAEELLAGSFIELLRKKSVLQRLGVTTLNGLVGNIAIPRQSGAATAYWVGENAAPTESQQTVDQVTMSPKTVGAYTDFSRKLIIQSSVDVENMVKGDLAQVLALAIDLAGLYGSGSSNQPTGLYATTGVNTKNFAADAPTWAEIVDLETLVAADNADIGSLAYATNAIGRGALKTTEKASSTAQYLMDASGMVNGYKCEVSNQIAAASAAADYFFGNWADLVLGFWSGLDLLVDPYTGGKEGTVRVIAHQDVDVAVRHAESFAIGANNPPSL